MMADAPLCPKGSSVSQPPMPPGPPTQPQPQSWPQQGMQPAADRGVDPDGPATDAASMPTDGSAADSIDGWTPPPWSAGPDAPAGWTPPPWTASPDAFSRIPARWLIVWLIVGALVLVGAFAGAYFGEPKVAPVEPTQVPSGLPHDYKLRVDLRVGDCFDLNDPTADQIEDVKAVPCTTEHEFEVFYVGAMGKGGYPTDAASEHQKSRTTSHRHRRRVLDVPGPELHPRVPCLYRQGVVRRFRPRHLLAGPDRRCLAVGRSDRAVRRLLSGDLPPDTVAPGHAAVSPASKLLGSRRAKKIWRRGQVARAARIAPKTATSRSSPRSLRGASP